VRSVLKIFFAKTYHTWPSWSGGRRWLTDFGLQKSFIIIPAQGSLSGYRTSIIYISMSLFQYLYNTLYIYNHVGTLHFIVLDAGCNLYYVYYKRRRQRSGRRCEIQPQKYDLRFVQRICIHKYIYLV